MKLTRLSTAIKPIFQVALLLVVLDFWFFMWFFGWAVQNGQPLPSEEKSAKIDDKGRIIYVSQLENAIINTTRDIVFVGYPVIIVAAISIEWFEQRKSSRTKDQ